MRRILVPLDGSRRSESVLPDATDFAGHGGEIVLLHVITSPSQDNGAGGFSGRTPAEGSAEYLESIAVPLRAQGFTVNKQTMVRHDASAAIDEVARESSVDMIICATDGRTPGGRLVHGGTAWRALANSPVPIMLRHVADDATGCHVGQHEARIMVPLDGSRYAEKAVPLAERLALKWNAPLWLVRVVEYLPDYAMNGVYPTVDYADMEREAAQYLDGVAAGLGGDVKTHSCLGTGAAHALVQFAGSRAITHVVLASHGRTGLPRMVLGSVADALVHRLRCAVVVIPALAAGRLEERTRPDVGGRTFEPKRVDASP